MMNSHLDKTLDYFQTGAFWGLRKFLPRRRNQSASVSSNYPLIFISLPFSRFFFLSPFQSCFPFFFLSVSHLILYLLLFFFFFSTLESYYTFIALTRTRSSLGRKHLFSTLYKSTSHVNFFELNSFFCRLAGILSFFWSIVSRTTACHGTTY